MNLLRSLILTEKHKIEWLEHEHKEPLKRFEMGKVVLRHCHSGGWELVTDSGWGGVKRTGRECRKRTEGPGRLTLPVLQFCQEQTLF